MPPVSASQASVYCAWPSDAVEVVGQAGVDVLDGAVAMNGQLAQVADVEDADGVPDRGVLLQHPGALVLQRHLPAAELGELGAEGDMPVVQRGVEQGHARQRSAIPRALMHAALGSTPVTSYTLRKGSPAKTRTDLVVIGVARTKKGGLVPAPGAEDVAEAYGRRFKPLLSSMGFKADAGEVLRLPAGDPIRAGQLLVIGLGSRDTLTLDKVRRAAGVAARNLRNAASVALALPRSTRSTCARWLTGSCSGLYTFPPYKSGRDDTQVSEVAILSDAARRQDAMAALDEARVLGDLVRVARDWVNTPPNDLTPEMFADSVSALATQAGPQEADGRGARRPRAREARLRRDPRRRPGLAPTSHDWSSSPGRRRTPAARSPWWARASPTTPAGSTSSPAARWRR